MVSETAALHGGHDHATRMDAFVWCGAARVSRHAASQPDDVALHGWPRQCGHEPHDETPACSRGDVGHVSGDGRSDWLPNFKAEPSHGDASHRNAVRSHYARSRRMVSPALWPMRYLPWSSHSRRTSGGDRRISSGGSMFERTAA